MAPLSTVSKLSIVAVACLALGQARCAPAEESAEAALALGGATDVCTTAFGDVQRSASNEANTTLSQLGVIGNFSLAKTQIGQVNFTVARKEYVGAVYRFTASIDLGAIATNGIADADAPDNNIYVSCDFTASPTSSLGYAKEKSAQLDDAGAKSLCQNMKTEADKKQQNAIQHAAISTQGLVPTATAISGASTSSKLTLVSTLKTGGSYTTEDGEKQGYTFVKDKCKSWFSSAPTYTYPQLNADGSGTPTGTPEMSVCADPYYIINEDPGIFWVDSTSGSLATSFSLSPAVTQVAQGTSTVVHVDVPTIASLTPSSSTRDTFVSLSSKCGWDEETSDWWIDPSETCASLPTTLRTNISQSYYDGLYVDVDPSTGTTKSVGAAANLMDLIAGIILDVRGAALDTDARSQLTIKSISVDTTSKRLVVVWEAVGC